ncbi:MAG: hypothetical protein KAR40_05955 [Candidatus Sabulitectum sp.]|nr:hypothetical protein [Candidatus Sabulitectum sp.]
MSNRYFQPWKSLKTVLHLKWLAPFLTVPVLFVASMFIESWLQESGMISYIPVGKRSIFSLWRIVMLTGMVAAPLVTMFLSEAWKKWKNSGVLLTSYFFGTIFSVFVLTTTAMVLNALGILSPLGVSLETISQILFARCIFAAVWVVAAATLCSSITSGPGGAALSFGLFSIALLPGLSGSSISWWFIAPLGDMVTTVDSLSNGWDVSMAVAAHSMIYLAAGFFILKKATLLR